MSEYRAGVECNITCVWFVFTYWTISSQGSFLFALVWSVGASTGNDGRKGFNMLIREISTGPLLERTKSVVP